MKLKKEKISEFLVALPSLVFSSPIVTTITTILLARMIPYFGLVLSSIFFYIFLPILTYIYLKKVGLITDARYDFNIKKREERPLYNTILIIGFLTNHILISMYSIPVVKDVSLFLLLSFLIFTVVTFFWKISGHMTQTVLGILIFAYVFSDIRIYILLAGYLIFVPLVALSRVKLKHHTVWQVLAGTFVTTLVGVLVFTIA